MPRFLKAAVNVAELAGACAIVDGLARWSVPVAIIVAGVLVVAAAEILDRGLR